LVLAGGRVAGSRVSIDLANPAQIEQYRGIKHADDKHDAFFLAELQRLNILPKHTSMMRSCGPVAGSVATADRPGAAAHRVDTVLQESVPTHHRPADGLGSAQSHAPGRGHRLYSHPATN